MNRPVPPTAVSIPASDNPVDVMVYAAFGAAVGGVVGLVIGGIAGSQRVTERWELLPTHVWRASARPGPSGAYEISAHVRF